MLCGTPKVAPSLSRPWEYRVTLKELKNDNEEEDMVSKEFQKANEMRKWDWDFLSFEIQSSMWKSEVRSRKLAACFT
jgi:hypothetical protein